MQPCPCLNSSCFCKVLIAYSQPFTCFPPMKLPKALLGAIAVGVAVQATTSCGSKKNDPTPKEEQASNGKTNPEGSKTPINCPACGLG